MRRTVSLLIALCALTGSFARNKALSSQVHQAAAGIQGVPSGDAAVASLDSLQRSPTEQRNPRSMRLDTMSISKAVALMVDEDARIRPAILKQRRPISLSDNAYAPITQCSTIECGPRHKHPS